MEATAITDKMLEELRGSLRKVLRWAEMYDPSRDHRLAYEADLDEAEALLEKTAAPKMETPGSRKPFDAGVRKVQRR